MRRLESLRIRAVNLASLRMESTLKEMRSGSSVLDLDPKSAVGGGVEDVYGEDNATQQQAITPWTVSVARSISNLI